MSAVLHVSWEYPPWAVGDLSRRLKGLLPQLNQLVPLSLVVRADRDEKVLVDGIEVWKVGTSVRAAPNFIAYSHAMNIELARGGSDALHGAPSVKIIHGHDWISSIAGVYLSAGFGLPLIISAYSTEATRARPPFSVVSRGIYDLERYCFHKAETLVVENEWMRNHIIEQYKPPGGIEVCGTAGDVLAAYGRWLH